MTVISASIERNNNPTLSDVSVKIRLRDRHSGAGKVFFNLVHVSVCADSVSIRPSIWHQKC